MVLRKIRIGTRGSRLALAQVNEITSLFPEADYDIKVFETSGDKDKATPLDKVEGLDFFTDMIEEALFNNEIDLAVHSAKDLPEQIRNGLSVVLTTKSINKEDVLVSRQGLELSELPAASKIGTSSKRRKEQVLKLRPDLKIIDLRGNVDVRLQKLDQGEYDAIVVARAALKRLGLENRITEKLPFETAKGQGSLALEIRENDKELGEWLKAKSI